MNLMMLAVAEELATKFCEMNPSTVLHVVSDCVEKFPEVDPLFIEQASRARLEQIDGAPEA